MLTTFHNHNRNHQISRIRISHLINRSRHHKTNSQNFKIKIFQNQPFQQYYNRKSPHFQHYGRGKQWFHNNNWGYRGGFNNFSNRFNNPQNPTINNFRGNNFKGNSWGYNPRSFFHWGQNAGNSFSPSQVAVDQSDNPNDMQVTHAIHMQSASLVRPIPSYWCSTCDLYKRDQGTILHWGLKLHTASLATNSQVNLMLTMAILMTNPIISSLMLPVCS